MQTGTLEFTARGTRIFRTLLLQAATTALVAACGGGGYGGGSGNSSGGGGTQSPPPPVIRDAQFTDDTVSGLGISIAGATDSATDANGDVHLSNLLRFLELLDADDDPSNGFQNDATLRQIAAALLNTVLRAKRS